ncbi:MAG: hypothetical protein WAU23_06475 [Ferruginibacter sp.]
MKKIFLILLPGSLLAGIFSFKNSDVTAPAADKTSVAKKTTTLEEVITLTGLETKPFIPPKAPGSGGDNDFFGHGPAVHIVVELFVKSKSMLYARVTMDARERGGDDTHAYGKKEYFLYFAGFGNEILSIQSPATSSLFYNDDDHGEDYVGKIKRVKAGDAAAYWNEHPAFVKEDELVKFCVVVGDTEGAEVATRTAVRVYFNPIVLKLKNPAVAPINNFNLNVTGVSSCGENTCSGSSGAGLLGYYGIHATCEEVWNRERSVSHAVNWVRDAGIANMGIPPNVLRDKLKEWKPDVQLRMLTPANYFVELRKIIKDQRRPVIALMAWGSRCVKDSYAPTDDSYGIGKAILHYVIVEGWDDGSANATNQKVWHVIDNGVHKNWSQEYFASAFFWKPENFVIEGILYPQNVHPGNIVY